MVLSQLMLPPFEPLALTELHLLTWKVVFLVAITSARCSSELCALIASPLFTLFHKEKVVRSHPTFMPKVASSFHCLNLWFSRCFFPSPSDSWECVFNTLDIHHALSFYLAHMSVFRQDPQLFVTYGPPVLAIGSLCNVWQAGSKAPLASAISRHASPFPRGSGLMLRGRWQLQLLSCTVCHFTKFVRLLHGPRHLSS